MAVPKLNHQVEYNPTQPPRLRLINLRTEVNEVVQFNPTNFSEQISVNYARPQVLGQSHQELQYLSTSNLVVPMELFFLSQDIATHAMGQRIKRFLYSLCYPTRGADSVVNGAPPRVLVIWPGVLSLSCKITQLGFENQRFNQYAEIVQFTAKCNFEEMRDVRWTSEDALQNGIRRTQSSGRTR